MDRARAPAMSVDRALQHVDSLVAWSGLEAGAGKDLPSPRAVRSVAILGAGMMGTAIAAATARHQLPVVISDADRRALADVRERIAAELAEEDLPGDDCPPGRLASRIVPTGDDAALAACDLVIESITESAAAKQALYARLEPRLGPDAILASNTSTIPIGRLAEGLADPGRFCGLHFFHPVRRRKLVEVVRGPRTRAQTIATTSAYARQIGKIPIVVEDGPGFLVNRLLVPFLTEALELVQEGVPIEAVEQAAVGFGMAMGPLRLLDEIGLDTVWLAGRVLWEAFPERIPVPRLLVAMYKAGRLGRKAGKGFFAYPEGLGRDQPGQPDPSIEPILAAWARPPQSPASEAILARLLLPMVLEATRVLEEKRVGDPREIDLGVLFGLGFPAARGGLLYWADTLGPRQIVAMLGPLEPLGGRARPTPMLLQMAAANRGFYGDSS